MEHEARHCASVERIRRPPRRPRTIWPTLVRVLALLAITALVLPLVYLGPLVFIPLVGGGLLVQRLLARGRDAELAERARRHRAEALQRAIDAGGPRDEPAHGPGKRDLREVRSDVVGPRYSGYVGGFWPRGRV